MARGLFHADTAFGQPGIDFLDHLAAQIAQCFDLGPDGQRQMARVVVQPVIEAFLLLRELAFQAVHALGDVLIQQYHTVEQGRFELGGCLVQLALQRRCAG